MKIELNAINIGIIILVLIVGAYVFLLPANARAPAATNSMVSLGDPNTFSGSITGNMAPQTLEGRATTDEGCGSVGNGLVKCTTRIVTDKGTTKFTYQHNMNKQPCLAMSGPENIVLKILDFEGNAVVTRTSSVSMH